MRASHELGQPSWYGAVCALRAPVHARACVGASVCVRERARSCVRARLPLSPLSVVGNMWSLIVMIAIIFLVIHVPVRARTRTRATPARMHVGVWRAGARGPHPCERRQRGRREDVRRVRRSSPRRRGRPVRDVRPPLAARARQAHAGCQAQNTRNQTHAVTRARRGRREGALGSDEEVRPPGRTSAVLSPKPDPSRLRAAALAYAPGPRGRPRALLPWASRLHPEQCASLARPGALRLRACFALQRTANGLQPLCCGPVPACCST